MTRILVIDDEPINHQLVAHALGPLQCEIHYADNGKSGISQARNLKPDVIITDVMMPDINGYEVTRILRREPQFAATPILVLTAQSGLQDKLKSFEAGADDHITKPFDPAELVVRVTSLLRRMESVKLSGHSAAARDPTARRSSSAGRPTAERGGRARGRAGPGCAAAARGLLPHDHARAADA